MNKQTNKLGVIIIEGHVQGLANARALGREGIPVYVVDTGKCIARYSKYCKKFFYCPEYRTDNFADFLIRLAIREDLKDWVLLPSNDHAVYSISKHKEKLEKYYKFTIQDLSVINKIYNKANLLTLAESCYVPIPKTQYFDNLNDKLELDFPVLTKGKEGRTFGRKLGRKAILSKNEQEFKQHIKEISDNFPLERTFTQELIPYDGTNKTISFTAFCIDGEIKTYWMGIKLREHPLEFGTATLTESVYVEECLIQSEILLKKLNYLGVCEVEFLKDPRDNKFKLIEINPRTWLWVGQAIRCGINYPLYIYNFLNGIENHYPTKYELGLKWFNPYTDFVFSLQAILKKKLRLRDFIFQLSGQKTNALTDKKDMFPFYMYGILMIHMLKNR
jgi:predicted ATP-grasp superfamily ATP-dependent carboligase